MGRQAVGFADLTTASGLGAFTSTDIAAAGSLTQVAFGKNKAPYMQKGNRRGAAQISLACLACCSRGPGGGRIASVHHHHGAVRCAAGLPLCMRSPPAAFGPLNMNPESSGVHQVRLH